MTERELTWTHQGKTINVGEDGLFGVTDGGWGYISLADARTDIDRELAERAVEARANIALPALTDEGKPCTITGIHRGTGNLLYTPKGSGYRETPAFPDAPQVRTLLARRNRLNQELERINERLNLVTIEHGYGSYKVATDADYPATILKLKADYARVLGDAQKLVEEDA